MEWGGRGGVRVGRGEGGEREDGGKGVIDERRRLPRCRVCVIESGVDMTSYDSLRSRVWFVHSTRFTSTPRL